MAFVVAGTAWVVATDVLVFLATRDPALVARVQITTDWLFVLVSAVVLYWVARAAATRLMRAHAVLSAVLESIADGLLVLGRDRTIVHANASGLRMLRCQSLSELLGMGAEQFSQRYQVSYPNGARVKPADFASQRVFFEGGPLQYKAVLHPAPNTSLEILSTASAVRARPGDRAALVVSVMHDITDSEHIERLRDGFFSAAAHALKTPVAIIKANVQIMARTSPENAQGSVAAIERQCDRVDRLVQNLLVVARARTRSLKLYPHELELASLVRETSEQLKAASRSVELRLEIDATPRVLADRERLALALRNVWHGALQASIPGSPLTARLTQQGRRAELRVTYEPLPLMERTFSGHEDCDDTSISQCATATIVDAHGGELREEVSGPATTLSLTLPMLEEL